MLWWGKQTSGTVSHTPELSIGAIGGSPSSVWVPGRLPGRSDAPAET